MKWRLPILLLIFALGLNVPARAQTDTEVDARKCGFEARGIAS